MLQNLYKLIFFFYIGAFSLYAVHSKTDSFSQEETRVVVTLRDLVVEQDCMMATINGFLCPVHSLEKKGNTWIAGVDLAANYCPKGHPMCGKCSLCHIERCPYYVRPCWMR